MKVLVFIKLIFLTQHKQCWKDWESLETGFDQDWRSSPDNCDDEEEIHRLRLLNPSQCKIVDTRETEEQQAFMNCKEQLASILQDKCDYSSVDNPGELLYCKVGAQLLCCYR